MIRDPEFDFLLDKIQKAKAVDFTLYRHGTLKRRIQSRMRATNCNHYSDYVTYLNKNSQEYDRLLDALTINVTEFFRDPAVFDALEHHVIPEIIREKEENGKKMIRIWSAGCSRGQEAYSLAMLFLEVLQQRKTRFNWSIYGTDIDPRCLEIAKQGIYEPAQVEKIPQHLLQKYFLFDGHFYQVCNELKEATRFGRHNLVSDKPLPFMDLVLCRNVLIYFTRPLQEAVCRHFASCLHGGGFLVLGKVESFPDASLNHLQTVDLHERIYRKVER